MKPGDVIKLNKKSKGYDAIKESMEQWAIAKSAFKAAAELLNVAEDEMRRTTLAFYPDLQDFQCSINPDNLEITVKYDGKGV